MLYNVFRGGFIHIKSHPLNIFLGKSNYWKNGIITIENIPLYRLTPLINNHIEFRKVDENYGLYVNKRMIYEKKYIFYYNIKVELINNDKNKPYASFIKLK